MTKEKARARFAALGEELFELQDALFGAKVNSVLVVLQGRDSAGKDGAIKHVAGCLNPRGVQRGLLRRADRRRSGEHDFLWRVHRHAPRLGEFAIFNRSHYEDVLVVRVHDLAREKLWQERYGHIADFEELLAEHGTIVLKFFLHITQEGAEGAPARAREAPRDRVEAQPERLEGARPLGRVHRGLRGRDLEDRGAARAVDRGAGERQVVPQPGGRRGDRRGAARAPQGLEEDARRGWAARAAPALAAYRAERRQHALDLQLLEQLLLELQHRLRVRQRLA